jgi:hypothetical protein
MSDDLVTAVRGMLVDLANQMPMSEAEFRYRLEPLRADRESAVRALVDLLGEDPPLPAAATAALHELATPADADALVIAFRDVDRPERARTEIAQVLSAIAADRLEAILEPQELQDLSSLSIDTLLERLCDRAGTAQVIELYRG